MRRHPMPTATVAEYLDMPEEIQRAFMRELLAHWRENYEIAEQANIEQDAKRGLKLNESEPAKPGLYATSGTTHNNRP